jgi:hypothetical protein
MAEQAAVPPPPIPLRATNAGVPGTDPAPAPASMDAGTGGATRLDRLLAVAVLTPAQAVYVALHILSAASSAEELHDEASGARVLVTEHGDVQVEPATPGPGATVDEILGQVVANAQQLPAHPRPHQLTLLGRLETIVGSSSREPAAGADALRTSLDQALGPDAGARVAEELAALVAALDHVAPRPTAPHPGLSVTDDPALELAPTPPQVAGTGSPAGTTTPSQTGRGATARALTPGRPRGPAVATAIVVVLVALVLTGGYLALNRPGSGSTRSPGGRQPSAGQPSSGTHHRTTTRHRSVVPTFAPRASGRIRGVTLGTAGDCRAGGPCQVRVTVQMTPAALSQTIGWRVGVVGVCSHLRAWTPLITVTSQPGWTHVYATSTVRVPAGQAVALVAVTSTPDRAQSAPDRLAGSGPRC